MEQALQIRQALIQFYKQNEVLITIVLKFIIGFFVFFRLSFLSLEAASEGLGLMVILGGALLCAVTSPSVFFILTMLGTGLFLSFASIELAILVMIFYFLVIVFYSRMFPKESLLIPALLIGYYFKIPYIVPIFAGIYIGFIGIIPIWIGSFLWSFLPHIEKLVEVAPRDAFTPIGMLDSFIKLYVTSLDLISKNQQWVVSSIIFSVVIVVTAILAHFAINYAKQISAVFAGVSMLVCFIASKLIGKWDGSIVWLVLGLIVSVFFIWMIIFFEMVLDYPRCDRVEFEDNENYYYVKIIPKVMVGQRHKVAQRLPSWERTKAVNKPAKSHNKNNGNREQEQTD